jgi:hypothetical protein
MAGTTRWWCHSHVGVYTGVPSSEGSGDDSSHSARDTASATAFAAGHGQGRELGRAAGIPSKVADALPRWRPFFEAMSQVRSLGLRSQGAFEAWSKSGSKPRDIPSNPQEKYRGLGWVSWADFLGLQEEGRKVTMHCSSIPCPRYRPLSPPRIPLCRFPQHLIHAHVSIFVHNLLYALSK